MTSVRTVDEAASLLESKTYLETWMVVKVMNEKLPGYLAVRLSIRGFCNDSKSQYISIRAIPSSGKIWVFQSFNQLIATLVNIEEYQ